MKVHPNAVLMVCIALASAGASAMQAADTPVAISAEVEQAAAALEANAELADRLSAEWTTDVITALRARGDADSLGLAFILGQGSWLAALARADDNADADAAKIDQLVDDQLSQEAQLIDRGDALSLPVLRMLAVHQVNSGRAQKEDPLTEALIRRAPEEMKGWSLRLHYLAGTQGNTAAITATLQAAAANVKGSAEHHYEDMRQGYAASLMVPMPEGLVQAMNYELLTTSTEPQMEISEATTRLFGFGMPMTMGFTPYQAFTESCKDSAEDFATRREACLTIARTLATEGEMIIDRGIGLSVWHKLVEGLPIEAEVIERKRQHRWQLEVGPSLLNAGPSIVAKMEAMTALILTPGINERNAMLDAMREADIDLSPPPQWMPINPHVLQARN